MAKGIAAAESAILFGTGFIDGQGSSGYFSAAESGDGFLSFIIVGHFHESEASGAARITVGHDADTIDGAVGFKERADGIFRR